MQRAAVRYVLAIFALVVSSIVGVGGPVFAATTSQTWNTLTPMNSGATSMLSLPTPDGTYVISNSWDVPVVTRLERATGALTSVTLPHVPYGMAITPDGNYAVATTNANPGTLEVINIASMTSVSLPVPALHWGSDMAGVAITADGNTAYVGQGNGGRVIVFDIHDRAHPVQTATEINACGSQAYFLALSPNQQDLFVACMAPSKVAVINLSTNTVRANIPLQFDSHPNVYPAGIVVSPDGHYVYTQNIGQGQTPYPSISVIDTRLIDNSSPNATTPRIHTTVLSQGGEWSQPSLNHDGSELASPSMYSLTDGTSAGVKIFETSDLIAGENASPIETVAIVDGGIHSSSVFSASYLPGCNSLLVSASVANANPAVVTLDRTGPACGSSQSQSGGNSGSTQSSGSSALANTGVSGSGLSFAAFAFLALGALVVGGMLALRRTR